MIVFLFVSGIFTFEPGCNDLRSDGQSECYVYTGGDVSYGLRCCLNERRGRRNFYEVPIVIIESYPRIQNQCRPHTSLRNHAPTSKCTPKLKCTPENFRDLFGFFNFLDFYQSIPFGDYPNRNKSMNWSCFNSNDNFQYNPNTTTQSRMKSKHSQLLKSRLQRNFCRSVMFYYFMEGFKFLSQDMCMANFLENRIYPYQSATGVKLTDFNPFEDHPKTKAVNKLQFSIITRDHLDNVFSTDDISKYVKNREKTTVSVFSDYDEIWRDLKVNSSSVLEYNCGCFN